MATGSSRRKGAIRKKSKAASTSGSGGYRKRGLAGRGPTPPAEKRAHHPAGRRAAAAERRASAASTSSEGRPRRRSGGNGDGPEIVAGRNPVLEALRAGIPATALYLGEGAERDSRLREALMLAAETNLPLLQAPRSELDRLTHGAVHQGVALTVEAYPYVHPDDLLDTVGGTPPLIVALDSVTDPRNLGAVMRSAAAFGATGVVIPERRSASMTAAAWKASAGAAARIPLARAKNLSRALASYAENGLRIAGLAMDGDVGLTEFDDALDPLVLVVGSEGRGLSRLAAESCDVLVSIPMSSITESLNASVAASVALYEVARQRAAASG